jgi:hypothetical protein
MTRRYRVTVLTSLTLRLQLTQTSKLHKYAKRSLLVALESLETRCEEETTTGLQRGLNT